MAREIVCPFCGFRKDDEYAIQLHIEEHHTEDSPFNIINAAPDVSQKPALREPIHLTPAGGEHWIKCTRPGCSEYLLAEEIQEHLDLHQAIDVSEEEASSLDSHSRGRSRSAEERGTRVRDDDERVGSLSDGSGSSTEDSQSASTRIGERNRWEGRSNEASSRSSKPHQSNASSGRSLLDYFSGSSNHGRPPLPPRPPRRIEQPRQPGRLGTKELGPHAFEKSMPAEVRRRLINDALPRRTNRIGRDGRIVKEVFIETETSGLITVLASLCARSRSTTAAYFCHPSVRHIHKIHCEGNFCGYWNIQMMCSFLANNANDSRLLPNVLDIQDTIEQAWDNGICSYSRIETGGIRGTRKWIGTHDALAYFTQRGVSMQALSFKDEDEEQPAVLALLDYIEAYYLSGSENAERRGPAMITELPPVYFQRAGHSMTIVGIERKSSGHRNLIIFDPSFGTTGSMDAVLDGKRTQAEPHHLLKPYRRTDESLSRWKEFEILIPQAKNKPSV